MSSESLPTAAEIWVVVRAGMALGKEIVDGLVGNVRKNATAIPEFASRRADLLDIDGRYVFYLATAAALYFAAMARRWSGADTEVVCRGVTGILADDFRYSSPLVRTQGERDALHAEALENLVRMYEGFSDQMARLVDLTQAGDAEISEAVYTWTMLHLMHAYPALAAHLSDGNIAVLFVLQRDFGQALITGFRHLPNGF